MRVLVDDAANGVGVSAGEGAVEHDLGYSHLPAHCFATRLEIDRLGQAFLRLGACTFVEAEQLGRRHRPLVFAGDLALGRDRLPARHTVLHHDTGIRRQRRQIRTLDRRLENASGLARGKRDRRHCRELDVRVVACSDFGVIESRFFPGRPRLHRTELLPHRIDAEIDSRRGQRRIENGGGKGEAGD